MTANASASARVILVNIVILLVSKPEAASADWIGERGVYFRARIRMGFARYKSSCACAVRGSHRCQLCSVSTKHHGIVMDRTRWRLEQSCLKWPHEPVICWIIDGTDPGNRFGNKSR